MQFSREIRLVLASALFCLTLVGLSATYWALAGHDTLLIREDNPRLVEAQARIQRGGIYDRDGRPLAETFNTDSGLKRRYLKPSTYSVAGYYSLRYGVGGAEAAYDDILAGSSTVESLADYVNSRILHRPQIGSDIMLTVDAEIQDSLANAMSGTFGAAIVMDVHNGAILALASLPSYDPNSLDADWGTLIEAEGNPFFNRALQGNYQLGGNIYALWLAQAIDSGFDLSWQFTGATDPVELGDGMEATCVIKPESTELSLTEAFVFGCPAAFKSYRQTESAIEYDKLVSPFMFDEPMSLAGFPLPEPIFPATGNDEIDPELLALRDALGQGNLTTTPLHLTAILAAIVNDGVAITPRIYASQRETATNEWQPHSVNTASRRMMPAATARRLQLIMQESSSVLWYEAKLPAPEVGIQLAMSRSGEETQLWLNGFVFPEDRNAVAFIVLVEDTDDVSRLLAIGRELISVLVSKY